MNTNEQDVEQVLSTVQNLAVGRLTGWGASRIPNDVDDEITAIIKDYLSLTDLAKKKIRENVGRDQKRVFLAFAERMASLAVRLKSPEPLMMAMMAMFLQVGIGDVREDIIILTLIDAATKKIGLDPSFVFLDSARQFGLEDTSGLEAYLERPNESKSLKSMGYSEGTDEDGFRFVRFW